MWMDEQRGKDRAGPIPHATRPGDTALTSIFLALGACHRAAGCLLFLLLLLLLLLVESHLTAS